MPRKEFVPRETVQDETNIIEVFDYGDRSAIIVPREVGDSIDPLKKGKLSGVEVPRVIVLPSKMLKMAVKKS